MPIGEVAAEEFPGTAGHRQQRAALQRALAPDGAGRDEADGERAEEQDRARPAPHVREERLPSAARDIRLLADGRVGVTEVIHLDDVEGFAARPDEEQVVDLLADEPGEQIDRMPRLHEYRGSQPARCPHGRNSARVHLGVRVLRA